METIRVILRKVIPLGTYRLVAKAINFLYVLLTNPGCIRTLYLSSAGTRTILPKGIAHPFRFRDNPHDQNVVIQNLIRHECLPQGINPKYVIDAGGYIGDSAALYLSAWPDCTCVVLEPSSNHVLAAANLAPYGNRAILLKAFLGRTSGFGSIEEAAVGSHITSNSGGIPILSAEQVLDQLPGGRAHVFKIDIEGAELDLLRPPVPWIDRVDMLVIELHGTEIEASVRPWLAQYGFAYKKVRSLHFFVRNPSATSAG